MPAPRPATVMFSPAVGRVRALGAGADVATAASAAQVGALAAAVQSTLPVRGGGLTGRHLPSGSILTARRVRRGGSRNATHPFQPYKPAGGGAFDLAIRPAFVDTLPAENETEVFTVPDGQADGYFFWAEVDLTASGGLTAWRIDHGDTVPVADAPDETTGEPPTPAYFLICAVTSDDNGVILNPAREYATTNKIRLVRVTDISDGVKTREVYFLPTAPETYYGYYDSSAFGP